MSSYLDTLNDRQKEAVVHGKAPLLILAGAGSGKTRVVTTRIAWLIEEMNFRPDQILAVTFTNKAAREMQDRVGRLVSLQEGESPMVKTFHSFCSWLLRRNAPLAGLSPHFTIYDDDDALALTKSILPSKIPAAEARAFQHWVSRAKDDDKRPEDDLRTISAHPDFPEVYGLYEAKLADTGNTDFGGLIQKTVRMLREHGAVRTRLQQKFPVVLVDEYQDCNGAQFELLKELYGPGTWLAVVGDDDQSIYRFRGADVGHILSFQDRFEGTTVIRLEQNYRSTQNILKVAGQVVAQNQGRLGKTLWTANPEGAKPRFVLLEDQDREAAWAVDLIRKSPKTETAVLYRTNAQSRAFESAFVRHQIPYKIVGTLRFYEREEIKDVLAWLSFLANPRDEVAFSRIVNKPSRGIGKSALEVVAEARPVQDGVSGSWLDAVGRSLPFAKGKAKTGLDAFLTLAGALTRRLDAGEPLGAILNSVIEDSGLGDYHRQQDEVQSSSKMQNLEELVSAASPFGGGRDGLTEFLETIELDTAGLSEDNDDALVTLITMHNTKGLEFDRVLVTGLEDGLFPRDETAHDRDELEEERRLFYVACTRARKELYFSAVKRRLLHGQFRDKSPSRFLTEIDKADLDGLAAAAPAANDGWVPGQKVYHDDYGSGIVVKKWYNVGELVLDVRFESGRMGRFLPQYTPLEKLASDD